MSFLVGISVTGLKSLPVEVPQSQVGGTPVPGRGTQSQVGGGGTPGYPQSGQDGIFTIIQAKE